MIVLMNTKILKLRKGEKHASVLYNFIKINFKLHPCITNIALQPVPKLNPTQTDQGKFKYQEFF